MSDFPDFIQIQNQDKSLTKNRYDFPAPIKLEWHQTGHLARPHWICGLKACPCLIILILSLIVSKYGNEVKNIQAVGNNGTHTEDEIWIKPR
jgi:hypothetical protein